MALVLTVSFSTQIKQEITEEAKKSNVVRKIDDRVCLHIIYKELIIFNIVPFHVMKQLFGFQLRSEQMDN